MNMAFKEFKMLNAQITGTLGLLKNHAYAVIRQHWNLDSGLLWQAVGGVYDDADNARDALEDAVSAIMDEYVEYIERYNMVYNRSRKEILRSVIACEHKERPGGPQSIGATSILYPNKSFFDIVTILPIEGLHLDWKNHDESDIIVWKKED